MLCFILIGSISIKSTKQFTVLPLFHLNCWNDRPFDKYTVYNDYIIITVIITLKVIINILTIQLSEFVGYIGCQHQDKVSSKLKYAVWFKQHEKTSYILCIGNPQQNKILRAIWILLPHNWLHLNTIHSEIFSNTL